MGEREEDAVAFNAESTNPKDFNWATKISWFNGSLSELPGQFQLLI